ncbi:MAG: hypothetical protein M3021_10645 [Actinomycetota bacterium]|nr:hypothetical protein [Actinomycetota bacterium]
MAGTPSVKDVGWSGVGDVGWSGVGDVGWLGVGEQCGVEGNDDGEAAAPTDAGAEMGQMLGD